MATELRIKGDDTRKVLVVAKYGQINPTRMIKYVLTSKVVSDDAKIGLRPRTYSAHQWRSVTTARLSRKTSRAIAQSASALVCQCLDGPAGRPGRFSSSSGWSFASRVVLLIQYTQLDEICRLAH